MTDLDARYGRKSTSTKRWIMLIAGVLGIAAGIGFAAWVAWDDVPHHRAEVFSFDVKSNEQTNVVLLIKRDKAVALTCRVYAQAEDKQIVGEKTVEIPSSSQSPIKVSIDIATQSKATTGALRSCDEH